MMPVLTSCCSSVGGSGPRNVFVEWSRSCVRVTFKPCARLRAPDSSHRRAGGAMGYIPSQRYPPTGGSGSRLGLPYAACRPATTELVLEHRTVDLAHIADTQNRTEGAPHNARDMLASRNTEVTIGEVACSSPRATSQRLLGRAIEMQSTTRHPREYRAAPSGRSAPELVVQNAATERAQNLDGVARTSRHFGVSRIWRSRPV
jgi:hypothetical protein